MDDNNQLKCQACGGEFKNHEELDSHAKQSHGQKEEQQQEHSMTCSKCGLKAKTVDEKTQHTCETC